jgi:hypothetical protein
MTSKSEEFEYFFGINVYKMIIFYQAMEDSQKVMYYPPSEDVMKLLDLQEEITNGNIDKLSEEDLIKVYKELWPQSLRSFALFYRINPGNFSRWLLGKKSSIASIESVKLWLLKIGPPEQIEEKRERKKLSIIKRSHIIKKIIFIDGDNNFNILRKIEEFVPRNEGDCHMCPYHVVIFVTTQTFKIAEERIKNKGRKWITFIHSNTRIKNATDFQMTLHICSLNLILPNNIAFVLTSADRFIHELIPDLKSYNPAREITTLYTVNKKEEEIRKDLSNIFLP